MRRSSLLGVNTSSIYLPIRAATSQSVSLSEILISRDQRYARQKLWLERYNGPLISFTVTAPGPVKDSRVTRTIFNRGLDALLNWAQKNQYFFQDCQSFCSATGPEAVFYLRERIEAENLKCAMIELEESEPLARLWDFDVLNAQGVVLSRQNFDRPPRRCFLCDRPAVVCKRGQNHSLTDLLAFMDSLSCL